MLVTSLLLCLLEVAIMSEFEKVIVESTSEDSASDTEEERINIVDAIHEPPKNQVPNSNTHMVLKSKIYDVGSGNIIGKHIIQEFFEC